MGSKRRRYESPHVTSACAPRRRQSASESSRTAQPQVRRRAHPPDAGFAPTSTDGPTMPKRRCMPSLQIGSESMDAAQIYAASMRTRLDTLAVEQLASIELAATAVADAIGKGHRVWI